ncbi:MAG: hypothetical protein EHM72_10590, partial [Calditrichaeota bacterium]
MKRVVLILLLLYSVSMTKEKMEPAAFGPTPRQALPQPTIAPKPSLNKFTANRTPNRTLPAKPTTTNQQLLQNSLNSIINHIPQQYVSAAAPHQAAADMMRAHNHPPSISSMLNRQTLSRKTVLWNHENGVPAFCLFDTNAQPLKKAMVTTESIQLKARQFLDESSSWMAIQSPAEEFKLINARRDDLGQTHLR